MQHGRRVHAMLAQLQQLCIIYSNLVQTMAAVAARRDRQRASEPRPQLLAPSMESACVHAQLYGRAAALARPCSRPLATRLSFARPSPRWVLQCLLGRGRGGTNSQLKPSCLLTDGSASQALSEARQARAPTRPQQGTLSCIYAIRRLRLPTKKFSRARRRQDPRPTCMGVGRQGGGAAR